MMQSFAETNGHLLELARDYESFAAAQDALCLKDDADPVEEDRIAAWGLRIGCKVAAQPATTIEGLQAKLRIVAILLRWNGTTMTEEIAQAGSVNQAVTWSILNDLPTILSARSAPLPLGD